MAGIAEGMEIVGEYTGKIGNALKKGVQFSKIPISGWMKILGLKLVD